MVLAGPKWLGDPKRQPDWYDRGMHESFQYIGDVITGIDADYGMPERESLYECQRCFALVRSVSTTEHEEWHDR